MERLIIILFLLTSVNLVSQPVIRSDKVGLSFQLIEDGNLIRVRTFEESINSGSSPPPLLLFKDLDFNSQQPDFYINYDLILLEDQLNYQVSIELFDQEGLSVNLNPVDITGDHGYIYQTPKSRHQISLLNFLELPLELDKKYTINLNYQLQGTGLDCTAPPKFQTLWPHLVGAGVGIGMIGLGGLEHQRFENKEVEYSNLYQNEASQLSGDGILEELEGHRSSNTLYNAIGIGVLLIDGVWFTIRLLKHKKRLKTFYKFCPPVKDTKTSFFQSWERNPTSGQLMPTFGLRTAIGYKSDKNG